MRKKLQDYLPPVLLKTYEFPLLCKTEQPEFDRLNAAATAVLDAQFVTTAGERGIARYEKIFKITPMDTDTLDERRFRVLARINAQLPFSVRRLRQQLETLCGAKGYRLTLTPNEYKITVRVELTARSKLAAVQELLDNTLPVNLICDCALMYNTWGQIKTLTWGELQQLTWREIKEKGGLFNGTDNESGTEKVRL